MLFPRWSRRFFSCRTRRGKDFRCKRSAIGERHNCGQRNLAFSVKSPSRVTNAPAGSSPPARYLHRATSSTTFPCASRQRLMKNGACKNACTGSPPWGQPPTSPARTSSKLRVIRALELITVELKCDLPHLVLFFKCLRVAST